VRRLATLGILAAFAFAFAHPLLACMLEYEQLSAEEQTCCRQMGGECGSQPDSSHTCCAEAPAASPSRGGDLKDQPVFQLTYAPAISPLAEFAPEPGGQLHAGGPPQPMAESPPRSLPVLRI
jgi:hypothetical protein